MQQTVQQTVAVAIVAVGGALGSVLRYLVSRWFVERFGGGFPWGTFAINVTGAFAIGVVLEIAAARSGLSPYLRLFLATGILGGYTTFSTYAFETLSLSSASLTGPAVAYGLGSLAIGVAAAWAGTLVGRLMAA
jgi:CrcB protein